MNVQGAVLSSEYHWLLSDLPKPSDDAPTVFSTFACGGGSTMGYKRAGFNVVGFNDIDPRMANVYRINHDPKYGFVMPISNLIDHPDLPDDLMDLDILDGSPPCSTFSTAGTREKKWGKKSHFREGQSEQVLDDLFFDFIRLVDHLRPKIVVAENVLGMMKGNAKGYMKLVVSGIQALGYTAQVFILDGALMGLPQKRQRLFFVARRNDLGLSDLAGVRWDCEPVSVWEAFSVAGCIDPLGPITTPSEVGRSVAAKSGELFANINNDFWSHRRLSWCTPSCTLVSSTSPEHPERPVGLTRDQLCVLSSFPMDYDFCDQKPLYVVGMSVPPLMMMKLAKKIREQWL